MIQKKTAEFGNFLDHLNTPPRKARISGLTLETTIFGLKIMMKSGVEFFITKLNEPLQRYLITCQANSVFMGWFFYTGPQQLWSCLFNFKIKKKKFRSLFIIIFLAKNRCFKILDHFKGGVWMIYPKCKRSEQFL